MKWGNAMCAKYVSILKTARLGNLGQMARRVAGLQYLSDQDFLPEVDADAAARLRDLARHARGDGPAPIIVLGVMPRSGSNMIRDVLALHPDVAADPGRLYEFPLLHAADGAGALMEEFISYFPRNAEVLGRYDALAMLAGAWLRELQRGDCYLGGIGGWREGAAHIDPFGMRCARAAVAAKGAVKRVNQSGGLGRWHDVS